MHCEKYLMALLTQFYLIFPKHGCCRDGETLRTPFSKQNIYFFCTVTVDSQYYLGISFIVVNRLYEKIKDTICI